MHRTMFGKAEGTTSLGGHNTDQRLILTCILQKWPSLDSGWTMSWIVDESSCSQQGKRCIFSSRRPDRL
jgi:hypothetical protein